MKKFSIAAALAAVTLALCVFAQPAIAQHVIDPNVVIPAQTQLQAPLAAAGAEFSTPAPSGRDGEVVVPWGDWLAEAIKALTLVAGGIVLWVLRKLPSSVVSALDAFAGITNQGRANELLEKAVNYGINVTEGAVKGKKLTLKVGNEVLERSVEYALDKAPFFVRYVLGLLNVRGMIVARLELDEDAALPARRAVAGTLAEAAPADATPAPAAP